MQKKNLGILFFVLFGLLLPAQPEKGLVAKYTFNSGTFVNDLGSDHPKAYNVDLGEDRFANQNMALFFQGYEFSFMNLGTSSKLKPREATISLWANVTAILSQGYGIEVNPIIVTKATSSQDCCEAYHISIGTTKPWRFETATQDSCNKISVCVSNQHFELGKWYNVVLTYNDDYLWFYVNGELQHKEIKKFKSRFLDGDSVMVGYYRNPKNLRFYKGYIDDILIYNRVLSASEILELYNAPNPNTRSTILKWTLVIFSCIFLISLSVWFISYRLRRSYELKAKLITLETRAIRSQMNPHFIFNSLNTLQRFILEDNKEKSYNYLIELSRLLRKLLESSELDTISLKEEINILTDYLNIEKQRFGHSFEFSIVSEITSPDQVHIPFMLVQPFAENAIWHGLLKKKGKRTLEIKFRWLDENRIECDIDDNGIGRQVKNENGDQIKRKSLGLDFIAQRLRLLKKLNGLDCFFEITDKKDAEGCSLGTHVRLIIPKY